MLRAVLACDAVTLGYIHPYLLHVRAGLSGARGIGEDNKRAALSGIFHINGKRLGIALKRLFCIGVIANSIKTEFQLQPIFDIFYRAGARGTLLTCHVTHLYLAVSGRRLIDAYTIRNYFRKFLDIS